MCTHCTCIVRAYKDTVQRTETELETELETGQRSSSGLTSTCAQNTRDAPAQLKCIPSQSATLSLASPHFQLTLHPHCLQPHHVSSPKHPASSISSSASSVRHLPTSTILSCVVRQLRMSQPHAARLSDACFVCARFFFFMCALVSFISPRHAVQRRAHNHVRCAPAAAAAAASSSA